MAKISALLLLLPLILADCPVSVILTKSDQSRFETSPGEYSPAVILVRHPDWTDVPNVNWVWVSDAGTPAATGGNWDYSQCVKGTYTFINTFTLAEWKRSHISSLGLSILVDDAFKVTFNGELLTPDWVSGFPTYELKEKYLGSTAGDTRENKILVEANNPAGPGGLILKVEVTYN